jgi:hypothetical protein
MAFLGFSVFDHIAGWFIAFHLQELQWTWIASWLILVFLMYKYIDTSKHPWILLFFLAFIGQYLLSLSGENTMLLYTAKTGHAEFVVTASRDFSIENVFRQYEVLVQQSHQKFSPSKPPGQLLLYMLFDLLSSSLGPVQTHEYFVDMRHVQLGILLTFILPFFAALTTIPLYFISKEYQCSKPWLPAFLYAISAPVMLILMHFDQGIYPLCCCTVAYTTIRASNYNDKNLISISILSGLCFAVSLFISFSMLPLLLLLPFLLRSKHAPKHLEKSIWIRGLISFLTGFLIFYLFLFFYFDYNPIVRFQKAMLHHATWKGWNGTWSLWWIATKVNILEWIWWLGPAVVFLFARPKNKTNELSINQKSYWLSLGMLLVIALMLCFGKTIAEVNRLWIFLTPFVWLAVAQNIDKSNYHVVIAICSLWTILLKIGMDFF